MAFFWNSSEPGSSNSLGWLNQRLNPMRLYTRQGQLLYTSQYCLTLSSPHLTPPYCSTGFLPNLLPPCGTAESWEQALQGRTPTVRCQFRDVASPMECSLQFDPETNLMMLLAHTPPLAHTPTVNTLTVEENDWEKTSPSQAEPSEIQCLYNALTSTEARWKALISSSTHLFLQTEPNGQISDINPATEQRVEYSREEILGRHITQFLHPEDFPSFEQAWQQWITTRTPPVTVECRYRAKSGMWLWLSLQGYRLAEHSGGNRVMVWGHDITRQKGLEAQLQASEERYQSLVCNFPGSVFRCDVAYTMHFMSDAIQSMLGFSADALIQNRDVSYLSRVHPGDMAMLQESLIQLVLDRRRSSIEYRVLHADGSIRWFLEQKQGTFDDQGNLQWLDGILLDVSDRKHAQVRALSCDDRFGIK